MEVLICRLSNENYLMAILLYNDILVKFLKFSNKTSIKEDLNEIKNLLHQKQHDMKETSHIDDKYLSSFIKLKTILNYSISQKRIINYHMIMLHNRLIKENNQDIFNSIKNKYL